MKKLLIIALPIAVLLVAVITVCVIIFSNSPGYVVSFNTCGGEEIKSQRCEALDSAPIPTRRGYDFDGWFFDEALTEKVVFPLELTEDVTLYAAWYKTEYTEALDAASIRFLSEGSTNKKTYALSVPKEIDIAEITRRGYRVQLTVNYEISYTRDWVKDFGYLGAPKYDVSILNSSGVGANHEELTAPDTATAAGVSYTFGTAELAGLTFAVKTQNIQNTVHLRKMTVTYKLVK